MKRNLISPEDNYLNCWGLVEQGFHQLPKKPEGKEVTSCQRSSVGGWKHTYVALEIYTF